MRRIGVGSVHPGPCRPHGIFRGRTVRRLGRSVLRRKVLRPVVIHGDVGNCRVMIKRHHCQTTGRTGLREIPIIVQRLGRRRVVRLTILRGLRHRSLAPVRRTTTCRLLVRGLGIARRRLTGHLKGDEPRVTGRVHLLSLPPGVRNLVSSKGVSVNRNETLLNLQGGRGLRTLIRGAIGSNLGIHRLRRLVRRLGSISHRAGGPTIRGSVFVGRHRSSLERQFKAAIRVGRSGGGKGVRVRFFSGRSLRHVVRLLRAGSWTVLVVICFFANVRGGVMNRCLS